MTATQEATNLRRLPCRCTACPSCRGLGAVRVRAWSQPGEFGTRNCSGCGGMETSGACCRCGKLQEIDNRDD